MKRVAILGSTGSIGTQALDILSRYDEYKFVALSANENIDILEKQALKYRPSKVGVVNPEKASLLRERLPDEISVLSGKQALIELAALPEVDIVLMSVVGISGLEATMAALRAGKDIALANKETLVAGGALVMEAAKSSGRFCLLTVNILRFFNACRVQGYKEIQKIFLTASGGPFRGYTKEELKSNCKRCIETSSLEHGKESYHRQC